MYRKTYAAIDLDCIKSNIINIKNNIGESGIIAVVKADAYGHGVRQVAEAALNAGAEMLAVAMCEEGVWLRKDFTQCQIIVLGHSNQTQMELGIANNLSMCVFKNQDVLLLSKLAMGKRVSIQLKLDTGMSRIGVNGATDLEEILKSLNVCKNIEIAGVFTHFSCSDDICKDFTKRQYEKFLEYIEIIHKYGYIPKIHCSNSAAAVDLPDYSHDYVRLGISMYGYYASDFVNKSNVKLKPAMEVMAEISNVKYINEGDCVGYGATYKATKRTKIATVQIGYGDGYNRLLSNKGKMIVKDKNNYKFANIVGRVCMDQTMIDVTHVENIKTGDEVVVMGSRGKLNFDAYDIAKICDTISYEIVLSYTNRVPRIYK